MIHQIHGMVWGPVMLAAMIAVGVLYSFHSGFFQFRKFGYWWKATVGSLNEPQTQKEKKKDRHSVTKIQAACTALAATVGTGNIVGVATALTAGGPGAIFWMWVSAGIGMMTAYAETSLGIRYRYKNAENHWICGPMVYLERGLSMPGLGFLYSMFCILSSLGMGSMVQSNAIAETMNYSFGAAPVFVGAVLVVFVFLVIWGGISRIARVSERLMPLSAGIYIVFSLTVILSCYDRMIPVLLGIVKSAFTPDALLGGAGGYGISRSLRYGIARGVFSNEAGLGSLAILHGATEDTTPEEQGMWAMFEVFFDTVVICTLTALVILCMTPEGLSNVRYDGAALTTFCFERRLGEIGEYLVSCSMLVFAFATIIAWYFLGRQAAVYALERLGQKIAFVKSHKGLLEKLYLLCYLNAVYIGCISSLKTVWELSDIWNGLMAVPNLIALLCLMKEVVYPKSP